MKTPASSATNLVIVFLGAALVVFFAGVFVVIAVKQPPPTQLWAAGGAISGALVGVLMPSPGRASASVASAASADAAHGAALEAARRAQRGQPAAGQAAAAEAVEGVRNLRAQIHATNARITRALGPAAAAATAAQTARVAVQALTDDAQAGVQRAQHAVAAAADPRAGHAPATGPGRADPAQSLAMALSKHTVLQAAAAGAGAATEDATMAGIAASKRSDSGAIRTIWILAGLFIAFLAIGIALETVNGTKHPAVIDAGKAVITLASSAGAALVALFAPEPASSSGGDAPGTTG